MSTIQYLDNTLKRIKITIEDPNPNLVKEYCSIKIHYISKGEQESVIVLIYLFYQIDSIRKISNGSKLKESLCEESMKLAKWMAINGSYKYEESSEFEKILLSEDKSEEVDLYFTLKNDTITIDHSPLSVLRIEESRIARKAIIHYLYENHRRDHNSVTKDISFPEVVLGRELDGLKSSRYVKGDGNQFYLSTEGREYYEKRFGANIGNVFVIAACKPNKDGSKDFHDDIIKLYSEIIRDVGLNPIFQEHEEPYKNIYLDIFDYIDTCEFVVADITWERPNCYVEIGYAMAKRKNILLFVGKEYFDKKMKKKIPFDIGPYRYNDYSMDEDGLKDLKKKLKQRIEVLRSRRTE